ncbi:MAG: hypothetical protein JJ953_04010 [Gracilimonas sp.]|uniref:TapB family protein n=1 Tax=Gracilimonas TaxID=649462 RepID=UPI001B23535D|nr:hypothetical protein [Gracilimonas sp.]MBO6585251.1 hypothetical protein [Gracilimonas sp.]MBO6615477.1 hypothetical protein [Gracilimonas sp.]
MKSVSSFILISCFTSLFIFSCKNEIVAPKDPVIAKSYSHFLWPNAVGNQWIYDRYVTSNFVNSDTSWEYESFDSFHIKFDSIDFTQSKFIVEIEEKKDILLKDTLYNAQIINNGFRYPYYFGKEDIYNLGIYDNKGDSLLKKGLYLPNPLPDTPWDGQFSLRIDGILKVVDVYDRRVVSKDEVITTPAGTFECYVIRTMVDEPIDVAGYLTLFEYYAPEVGLVAKVRLLLVPNLYWYLDYVDLLKRYELKQ